MRGIAAHMEQDLQPCTIIMAIRQLALIIIIIDSGYNCSVNNITLARNGTDKINNVAGNYTQNSNGSAVWLKANATAGNWEII